MTDQTQDERIAVPPEVALEEAYGLAEFHRLRALKLMVKLHGVRQELDEMREANERMAAEVAAMKAEISGEAE